VEELLRSSEDFIAELREATSVASRFFVHSLAVFSKKFSGWYCTACSIGDMMRGMSQHRIAGPGQGRGRAAPPLRGRGRRAAGPGQGRRVAGAGQGRSRAAAGPQGAAGQGRGRRAGAGQGAAGPQGRGRGRGRGAAGAGPVTLTAAEARAIASAFQWFAVNRESESAVALLGLLKRSFKKGK